MLYVKKELVYYDVKDNCKLNSIDKPIMIKSANAVRHTVIPYSNSDLTKQVGNLSLRINKQTEEDLDLSNFTACGELS